MFEDCKFSCDFPLTLFNHIGGSTEIVRELLKDPRVDRSTWMHFPLRIACANGDLEMVKLLMEGNTLLPVPQKLLWCACEKGSASVVAWLLERKEVDPSENNNLMLSIACSKGFIDVVSLLLQRDCVDPSMNFTMIVFNDFRCKGVFSLSDSL